MDSSNSPQILGEVAAVGSEIQNKEHIKPLHHIHHILLPLGFGDGPNTLRYEKTVVSNVGYEHGQCLLEYLQTLHKACWHLAIIPTHAAFAH